MKAKLFRIGPILFAVFVTESILGVEVGKDWVLQDLRLTLVFIPEGEFVIGTSNPDAKKKYEGFDMPIFNTYAMTPSTSVQITRPFWIGKTEITQRQYQAIVGDNPSFFTSKEEDIPVESVSWLEAYQFCKKLTQRERDSGRINESYRFVLPTEAQWEYAARAGVQQEIEDKELAVVSWHGSSDRLIGGLSSNSSKRTHGVGQKTPNAWRLHDMLGNVGEWCSDSPGRYPGGEVTDLVSQGDDSIKVVRGGSFSSYSFKTRFSTRSGYNRTTKAPHIGFRIAMVCDDARLLKVESPPWTVGDVKAQTDDGNIENLINKIKK